MKIVADDKIPFLRGVLEPFAEIRYFPGREIDNSVVKGADALLIRTRTRCDETLLKNSGVKFIGTATIGFDHIDTACCEERNIFWTNAPGCNSSSVRQYIASALLNISAFSGFSLSGKTIGIIGVGNVGSKVEQLATALGMNILLNDPPRAGREGPARFTDLDRLLKDSDILTVHVPLATTGGDRTFHLFDGNLFNSMKRGAWFINSSRGEVVDTDSLKKALAGGQLAGAVTDVWEAEPEIDAELLDMVFIGTPHIAGYSTDGKANGTAMVVNSLCRFFNLPLQNWYPENIPAPDRPVIEIKCGGKSDEEVLREAILHTYDIRIDDSRLRADLKDFEKLRGSYPVRREFASYTVKPGNIPSGVAGILKKIGFNIPL